jgi:hypothetical protein
MVQAAQLPKALFSTKRSGTEVMVGGEVDGSRGGELFRGRQVGGPAFEHEGATNRAAQRPAHALPSDGRPGVQHQATGFELRNQVAGAAYVSEHRLRRKDPPQRLAVPRFDLFIKTKSGWLPVHLDNGGAIGGEVAGEPFETDVDDADGARKQRVDRHLQRA